MAFRDDFVHLHAHSEFSLLDGMPKVDEYIIRINELNQPGIALTEHGNLRSMYQLWTRTRNKFGFKGKEYAYPETKPIFGIEFYASPLDHRIKGIPESIKDSIRKECESGKDYRTALKEYEYKNGYRKRFHVLAFAMNNEGMQNLFRMNYLSWKDGFYYRPRIDLDMLKKYNEGLIITTSCTGGWVPSFILDGKNDDGFLWLREMKKIFKDRLYVEIQPHDLEDQKAVNKNIVQLADEAKIKVVATNDCHYLRDDDYKAHEVLLAIQSNSTMQATDRWKFDDTGFYVRSREEMMAAFLKNHPDLGKKRVDSALSTTMEIFHRCNFKLDLDFKKGLLPHVSVPDGMRGEKAYVIELCKKGWKWRGMEKRIKDYAELNGLDPEEARTMYKDRLRLELDRIFKLRFESYFLIIHDVINWARSQGIMVGPGRGSSSASLACYLMGITSIDPIHYDLLFDRFLSITRIDYPDIDMDFEDTRRWEVIKYLFEHYGEKNVSQIMTVGRMKGKQALKDVGRVFGVPVWETNAVNKHIITRSSGDARNSQTVEDSFQEFEICKKYNEKYPNVLPFVVALEGKARQAGVHAAGVQIAPYAIDKIIPIEYRDGKDENGNPCRIKVSGLDWMECQGLGLVKLDVLGLKTLSIIKTALKNIKDRHEVDIDLESISLEDPKVLENFSKGRFVGIFQYDSIGMTKTCDRLTFTQFEDIIALNALYRPGSMRSGLATHFIDRKIGAEKVKPLHPIYDRICKETQGVLVYQEQLIKCFIELAGYDPGTADELRKKVAKSHGVEVITKEADHFIAGAVANGMSKKEASKLFESMAFFGSYAFNKAHAAAYGVIAYWEMYLKTYYTIEFFHALMYHEVQQTEIIRFVVDARKMGIEIRTPDINFSSKDFKIGTIWDAFDENGNEPHFIIAGLCDIKGCGEKAAQNIEDTYGVGKNFLSMNDFVKRVNRRLVNKGVIKHLVQAGAFKSIYPNTKALLKEVTISTPKKQETKPVWEFMIDLSETRGNNLYYKVEKKVHMSEEDEVTIMADVCPIPPYKHKIEYYGAVLEKLRNPSMCGAVEAGSEQVTLLGTLVDIKYNNVGDFHKDVPDDKEKKRIGWGQRYANINVEDESGILRVNVDIHVFPKFRKIIDRGLGTPVIVYGRTFFKGENVFCDIMADADVVRDALHAGKDFTKDMDATTRYFFDHPVKPKEGQKHTVSRIARPQTRSGVYNLTVLVIRVKYHWTKKDKRMAFIDIEDSTGRIGIIAWPEELEKNFKKLKVGKILNLYIQKTSGNGDRENSKDSGGCFLKSGGKIEVLETAWELVENK